MADMNYGMLASGSCLLTDIVDQLHETSKKINSVDRLSRHLTKGSLADSMKAYLSLVKSGVLPILSSISMTVTLLKPDGYKFESLGWVRDGSKRTTTKTILAMNRGYDDSKMFLQLDPMNQDYVIRLTAKWKLLYHNKWGFATELRNRRKGKVKLPLFYKGKISFCYYRLAKGISGILSYARKGVRLWFRTKRPAYRQLCLKLAV